MNSAAFRVLLHLSSGSKRFSEIVYNLNMHPKIVSDAIHGLSTYDFVKKHSERYCLTKKGLKAVEIIHNIESKVNYPAVTFPHH